MSTSATRRKNFTPGHAKQIRILAWLSEKLDKHAVRCDRLALVTTLAPCYVAFVYVAYTDFACIWDNDAFRLDWFVFPLSMVPYYVSPCFLMMVLPGLWGKMTKACTYRGCLPGEEKR